jgi:hypothetical protein
MLTGTGAGLVFGIQDALTRQTLEILGSNGIAAMFTTWAPYALVGAGATGIWLMQSAFNSGPLPLSLPAIAAGEPLVGILLGILVFGDRIQITPGEVALQACGIVALIVGVIIVGRAPALSHLRTWPPPGLPHITGGLPHITGGLPALPGRSARQARHPDGSAEPGEHDQAAGRESGPAPEAVLATDPALGHGGPVSGAAGLNGHPAPTPAPLGADETAEPQPLTATPNRHA